MAETSLQAGNIDAKADEFRRLHRAWRHVRAQWDLAETDPARETELDDDARDSFCDAEHRALLALLLQPAGDVCEVEQKLRLIHTEQAYLYDEADEIIERLMRDVRQLRQHNSPYPAHLKKESVGA
jgi:hypothetical protein